MNFEPVTTKADLLSLDPDEITAGYMEAERGDPEPGINRGRAYWHGWRMCMIDYREIESDAGHRQLAREIAPNGVLDEEVFGRRSMRMRRQS